MLATQPPQSTPDAYEATRQRHIGYLAQIMPEHVQRLRWSADQLQHERQAALRTLLRTALAKASWHRARLGGIDAEAFLEDDLSTLPVMTKDDLMANWDRIVADDRLRLERVERHLANLTSDAYLLDELHGVASGGSTGRRGVFVYGWEPWAHTYAGFMRQTLWDRGASPELAELPPRVAMVAAQHATHMTSSLADTFANPRLQVARFPVTLPIEHIVDGLNNYQPVMLGGYPTALSLLAEEARAGRLRIQPRRIMANSEPLLAETRLSIEHAFGAPVANCYGTSEGGAMAVGCWRGPGMHVCDDLVIVEPVDAEGRPVPAGVESDKIYVTALANPTLPLIRFELTDRVMFLEHDCACGSAHRLIADVQGRLDDGFAYPNNVVVHPHVFRSVLGRDARVAEYQVRQTAAGADIFTIGTPAEPALLERELCRELAALGVRSPAVNLRAVDALERLPTGKIRRFVPVQGRESSSTMGDGTRRRSF